MELELRSMDKRIFYKTEGKKVGFLDKGNND